ncbi:MAG: hypothetical protein ACI4BB_00910 [Coprococcus sp.]
MRERIIFGENGYTDLKLEKNKNYIVTKWYGSSLAIFEEEAFKKYLMKLDTDFKDNNHGRSVIRYFLSAAVTMVKEENEGWIIPPELLDCISKEGESIESWHCSNEGKYQDSLPILLLASSSNMDSAITMTAERH